MSVNKVILIGNLGQDPEVRSFQNGGRVCNMSVATNERWTDKQTGEKRERTEWHRVSIFNDGLVGVAEKYLRKGSKVYIEGQIETRKWQDQTGQDRYSTEIVLRGFGAKIVLLDKRDDNGSGADRKPSSYDQSRTDSGGGGGGMDDEIPFAPEWRV